MSNEYFQLSTLICLTQRYEFLMHITTYLCINCVDQHSTRHMNIDREVSHAVRYYNVHVNAENLYANQYSTSNINESPTASH